MKKLSKEGCRVKVRKLGARLGLKVTHRVAYKVTTKRMHGDEVAENLLNQNQI